MAFMFNSFAENCGPSQYLVMKVSRTNKSLELVHSKFHNDHFCFPPEVKNSNATIYFLDSLKKEIISRRVFINTNLFYDNKGKKGLEGGVLPKDKVSFNIKYPVNEDTKKVTFIKITFDQDGHYQMVKVK